MTTSYEILKKVEEIEFELLTNTELSDEDIAELNGYLSDAYFEMEKKVENYDAYLLSIEENRAVIDARIRVQMDELDRLRRKRDAIDKSKDYFYKQILPKTIRRLGDGEKFVTETATYKFMKKFGKLVVENMNLIKPTYLKQPPMVVDGVKARSAAIAAHKAGTKEEGFHVYEEQYVKRS